MPARLGIPEGFTGLIDLVKSPIHATGVGLVHYGIHHKYEVSELFGDDEQGMFHWVMGRMRRWFSGMHRYNNHNMIM